MPEDDQVKWVGVRPVNPPEIIPVSIAGSVACVKVEPCAGSPEFLTLTKKRAPAIADMQTIESFARKIEQKNNVGAPNYNHDLYTVPSGKILVLSFISAFCWQGDPTAVAFALRSGVTDYSFYTAAYGGAFESHKVFETIYFNEDEIVRIKWTATLATTDVTASIFGHLIDIY